MSMTMYTYESRIQHVDRLRISASMRSTKEQASASAGSVGAGTHAGEGATPSSTTTENADCSDPAESATGESQPTRTMAAAKATRRAAATFMAGYISPATRNINS